MRSAAAEAGASGKHPAAVITDAVQQRHWLERLFLMRAVPGTNQAEFDEIAANIAGGAPLPLLLEPLVAALSTPQRSRRKPRLFAAG